MRDYIEQRALEIGDYIIEAGATVRQAAKKFGISKRTYIRMLQYRPVWEQGCFGGGIGQSKNL